MRAAVVLVVCALLSVCAAQTVSLGPGSCHSDADCSAYFVCNEDSMCVPRGGGLPANSLAEGYPIVYVIVGATFTGLICCGVFIVTCVMCCIRPANGVWSPHTTDQSIGMFVGGVWLAAIVATLIALPLALLPPQMGSEPLATAIVSGVNCSSSTSLVCAPYLCDTAAGFCMTQCRTNLDCDPSFACSTVTNLCVSRAIADLEGMPAWMTLLIVGFICGFVIVCMVGFCARFDKGNVGFGVGIVLAIVIFLAVGLPLLIVRPKIDINAGTRGTAYPGVSQPLVRPWAAVLIALSASLVLTICSVGMSNLCRDHSGMDSRRNKTHMYIAFTTWACCVFMALIFGMSFGMKTRYTNVMPSSVGNVTYCASNAACIPYTCDTVQRECRSMCNSDNECTGGTTCIDHECSLGPTGTYSVKIVSAGAAAGIAIGSAVGTAICCFLLMYCVLCRRDYEKEVTANSCAAIWCVIVVLVVGLCLGLIKKKVSIGPTNEITCAAPNAVACAPYNCDMSSKLCLSTCVSDVNCAPSTVCTLGKCVADEKFDPTPPIRVLAGWEAAVISVAVACFFICILPVVIIRCSFPDLRIRNQRPEQVVDAVLDGDDNILFAILITCLLTTIGGVLIVSITLGAPNLAGTATQQCAVDTDCPAGIQCGIDGLCHIPQSIMTSGTLMGIIFGGGAGFVLCCTCLAYTCTRTCGKDDCEMVPSRTVMMGVALFVIFFLIVGAPLLVKRATQGKTKQPDMAPLAFPSINNTVCSFALDPHCAPYTCNVKLGLCLTQCQLDAQCQDGRLCSDDNRCQEVLTAPPIANPRWKDLTIAVVVMFCFLMCCLFWGARAGGRCNGRANCGIQEADFAIVGFCPYIWGGVIAFFLAMPLIYQTSPVTVTGNIAGPVCDTLVASQCFPYYCDLRMGMCATSCTGTGECANGFVCRDDRCALDDAREIKGMLGLIYLVFFVLIVLMVGLPPLVGWRRRVHEAKVAARRAAEERAAKEIEDKLTNLKREHALYIDVDPMGGGIDPTLPTPKAPLSLETGRLTASPSDFPEDTSAFERAIDAALTQFNLLGEDSDIGGNENTSLLQPGQGEQSEPRRSRIPRLPGLPRRANRPAPTITVPSEQGPTQILVSDIPTIGGPDPEPTPAPRRGRRDIAIVTGPKTEDTCSVCYSMPTTVRLLYHQCTHGYCDGCAAHILSSIVEDGQFPARCPGCRAEDPNSARGFIPSDTLERLARRGIITLQFCRRFIQQQIMHAFAPTEVLSCPVCTMINAVPASAIKRPYLLTEPHCVACGECGSEFCHKCNNYYHGHKTLTCEQYAAKRKVRDEEIATNNILTKTAKKCPGCGMGITHYRGHACHHIRPGTGCPSCGMHFCYVCLMPYPDGCTHQGHELFCDDQCGCPICPDCKPGTPCHDCDGNEKCFACRPPNGP